MNFEPQKLFIGLMDFFSILLPGALLTYLLMGEVGPVVLGDRYARLAGAEAWATFLFASFLFGHLVFLLGSRLDEFYDWARRHTLNAQIARLARRGRSMTAVVLYFDKAVHPRSGRYMLGDHWSWQEDRIEGRAAFSFALISKPGTNYIPQGGQP